MSQPHSSEGLSFVKHPSKPSTYFPGRRKAHHVMASVAVGVGLGIVIVVGVWVYEDIHTLVLALLSL